MDSYVLEVCSGGAAWQVEPHSTNEIDLEMPNLFWALNDIYFRSYRDEVSPTCTLGIQLRLCLLNT